MTRQLTSAVRHKLLRSPHAKRPPHGRLRSSRLLSSDWSVTTGAFIVTYLENRCKLTLDECIALFPTVEIFQAAWF